MDNIFKEWDQKHQEKKKKSVQTSRANPQYLEKLAFFYWIPEPFKTMCTNWNYPETTIQREIRSIAYILVSSGRGLLMADEPICRWQRPKRHLPVKDTPEVLERFRKVIFTSENGIGQYISGIFLPDYAVDVHPPRYEPTLVDKLAKKQLWIGVRVDKELIPLPGSSKEFVPKGLDNLRMRCKEYKELGVQFAKWRCYYRIDDCLPTLHAIQENANIFAKFANTCQSEKMVPVIYVDILRYGNHDIKRCQKVTETALSFIYKAFLDNGVYLEGTLLLMNMVNGGFSCCLRYDHEQVARATLVSLSRVVPPAVPGILFPCDEEDIWEEEATIRLNEMNKMSREFKCPWYLTFSFGRALQMSALEAWGGRDEPQYVLAAQREILYKAKENSAATKGESKLLPLKTCGFYSCH